MNDLIIKLQKEQNDLELKLNKLNLFIKSNDFESLDDTHKDLLKSQAGVMAEYMSILSYRIQLI